MDVRVLRNLLVVVFLFVVYVDFTWSQKYEFYDVEDNIDDGLTPAQRRRTVRPQRRPDSRQREREKALERQREREGMEKQQREEDRRREMQRESERDRERERAAARRLEDARQRAEARREAERERQLELERQKSAKRNSDSNNRRDRSRNRYRSRTTTTRETTTPVTTPTPRRSRGRTDSCGCPNNIEYSLNNLNNYVTTTTEDNKSADKRITKLEKQIRALEAMVETFGKDSDAWQASMRFPGLTVLHAPLSIDLTDDGVMSEDSYKDCQEATDRGNSQRGVYTLNPEGSAYSSLAFCQDGWTLLQRRFDGSTNFFRTYDEYVEGFGNFSGEFWLGLEMMHQVTTQDTYTLRIDLESHSGKFYYAVYTGFRISDEEDDYMMTYNNMTSGSGRDGLRRNKGQRFTTWDRDRDNWRNQNCAKHYKSGFWLDRCGSDLNRDPSKGIYGGTKWGGRYVKSSLMRVKPARSMQRSDYKAIP